MPRKQVDTEMRTTLLQPAASPVDTFVDPGPSPLRGLAESLGKLNQGIAGILGKRDLEKEKNERALGEAKFYKDNAEGFAEGVRTDAIPADASPDFVQGYKDASGYVAGGDLRLKFNAALDEQLPTIGEDPAAYDEFVAKFISENIQTEDPYVLRGLLPQVRELHSEGYARYKDYRSKAVYHGSEQAHGAIIAQDIDTATREGLSDPDGTDYAAVTERIATVRQAFIATGGKVEDADKLVIDAVTAKALQLRDRGLLDVLKTKVPGEEYTYADSPYGLDKVDATSDALDVIERRNATEEHEAYNRQKVEEGDKARSEITQILAADPSAPIPDELMARARKWDDTIDTKIPEWRRSLSTGFTDQEKLKAVYAEIMAGSGTEAVAEAMDAGVFGRMEDLREAQAFAKSYGDNHKGVEDMLADSAFKQTMEDLEVLTGAHNDLGDPIKGTSREGLEAQYDFKMAMIEWAVANPKATILERQEAIAKFTKLVRDRITPSDPSDPFAGGGEYNRPQEGPASPFVQEFTDAQRQQEGQPPLAEEEGRKADAAQKRATDEQRAREDANLAEDAATWVRGLTPEQFRTVETEAKAKGMSVPDYAKAILGGQDMGAAGTDPETTKSVPKEPTAQDEEDAIKAKPISYRAEESGQAEPGASDGTTTGRGMTRDTAMKYLQQALALPDDGADVFAGIELPDVPDPEASKLLALIYKHEAGGNFNAVYGNAGSTRDLAQLTLDQVLATQVAARRRGAASTAIGAPQFIHKTLKGLKAELGLTGKEKFTPALQNHLAMALLVRRGWLQFRAGKLSRRAFALRLSQEWASLPNPETGRSYYAGDNLNRSSVRPREVYAALGFV